MIIHGDGAQDQESLGSLQRTWLNLQHTLAGAERLFDFVSSLDDKTAGTMPENPCAGVGLALACIPNTLFYVAKVLNVFRFSISYVVLLGATIGFQVADDEFEIATLGAHH